MLTIAHRLATIATSDQIMVINNGSIAEMESPHVLKQDKKSHFYELCN